MHDLADNSLRRWLTIVIVSCLSIALIMVLAPQPPKPAQPPAIQLEASGAPGDTITKIATFNVLGHGHTVPGGSHPGYADSAKRMAWTVSEFNTFGVEIVGLQEFQPAQLTTFKALTGDAWGIYPGRELSNAAMANSIIWRRSAWQLVSQSTVQVPYFDGNLIRMPLVKLSNLRTGRMIYVYNTHHPADARGPAQRWRDQAVAIEVALAKKLAISDPEVPLFSLGDKNDRERYFCPIVAQTDLRAANGGSSVSGSCTMPPRPVPVDWLMASQSVGWSRYAALRTPLIVKSSDHPLVVAQARIPAAVKPQIRRVVVLAVDGLNSTVLKQRPELAPYLTSLTSQGASTVHALTAVESVSRRANLVGLLTSRRVDPAQGGHGVGARGSGSATTVHDAAGRYVSSVFDVIHNFGMTTAYFSSSPRDSFITDSWDDTNGAYDPYGVDDGHGKIDVVKLRATDAEAVNETIAQFSTRPRHLSVTSLSNPYRVGREYGAGSTQYRAALTTLDAQIKKVHRSIKASPSAPNTVLLIVGTAGVTRKYYLDPNWPANYLVPLIAVGPGIAPAELFSINSERTFPGRLQREYSVSPQLIRNLDLGNLVTELLTFPAIPGSTANVDQSLTLVRDAP